MKIVSKGGSLTASYMKLNDVENPFLKYFEDFLELAKEYDIVINLGNTLRSGCIHDKVDEFQLSEIKTSNKFLYDHIRRFGAFFSLGFIAFICSESLRVIQ